MENCLKTGTLKRTRTITDPPCDDSEGDDLNTVGVTHSEIEIAKETDEESLKYYEEYLKCGFTVNVVNDTEQVQCVICRQMLPNCGSHFSRFRQHLEKEHFLYKDKPLAFFEEKLLELRHNLNAAKVESRTKISEQTYRDLYAKAKNIDTYTLAEDLIVPCAKIIFESILGKEQAKKMDMNHFRNNILSEEILNMSNNVEAILLNRLKKSSFFALQVNWTELPDLPVLIVIVRYLYNGTLEEEMLLCRSLSETDAGVDIFFAIHTYLQKNEIDWACCCGISTDGAKSSTKMYMAFACCVKRVAPDVSLTYCSTRGQDITMKGMPHQLKSILDDLIKIVNVIKERPDRTGIFQVLYDEIGSNYKPLIKYTENWWLSHEGVLRIFFAHRESFKFYNPLCFPNCLNNSLWLQKLAYLVDIFDLVNEMSRSLSLYNNIFAVQNKVTSLINRLDNLSKIVDDNEVDFFPTTLDYFLLEKQMKLNKDLKLHIMEHLCALQSTFKEYFPPIPSSYNWICNPFKETFVLQAGNLSDADKECLLTLSRNLNLKTLFGQKHLIDFWLAVVDDFPQLSELAIKYLLPFSNTYLLEKAFSCYITLKKNYRINLSVEPDLRLFLTCIEPDFSNLCSVEDPKKS